MTHMVVDRSERLVHAFRRRRRLRTGVVQLVYVAIGLGLAFILPSVRYGPQIDESTFGPVLVALAGSLISFIALVFSLLFLVVQYGNTALSPRLNLFRDSPLVWHAFGMFVGVFVFCATSAIILSGNPSVTLLVPVVTVVLVVLSLAIMRRIQLNAFRSLQLGGALSDISARGRRVLVGLYHHLGDGDPPAEADTAAPELPPVMTTVTWPHNATMLRQIDVPRLVKAAEADDVVIELGIRVGDPLIEGRVVLTVHGHAPHHQTPRFLRFFETDLERTFNQDPLLAFRLLSDIGLRALSPAINDPATAVQALDKRRVAACEGRPRGPGLPPRRRSRRSPAGPAAAAHVGGVPGGRRGRDHRGGSRGSQRRTARDRTARSPSHRGARVAHARARPSHRQAARMTLRRHITRAG